MSANADLAVSVKLFQLAGLSFRVRHDVMPADVQRVADLVSLTEFFNAEEIAIARELVDEHLHKGKASGYWFVFAEADDELIGYACFGPVPATLFSYHLYWIVVAPAWQGHRLGRALVECVKDLIAVRGGKRLYAETSSRIQYAPTHRFYERSGFRRVAELPEFFAPGDGKLIYEKTISKRPVEASLLR